MNSIINFVKDKWYIVAGVALAIWFVLKKK